MIEWKKHGLLVQSAPKGFTHASHPTAICLRDNRYLLAYCGRDSKNHSHVFFQTFEILNDSLILNDDIKLALSPGAPGTFDSHGVLTCNFVQDGETLYLYYCGWLNLSDGLWHCDTGRAIVCVHGLTAEREFEGPIMGRRKDIPLYAVATTVRRERDKWIAWYNRGIAWTIEGEQFKPRYGIHFAQSENGIDWLCEDELIIPFADDHEHSFGRPTVILHKNHYLMWFAARGANDNPEYKIGLAISPDGKNWKRIDSNSGIAPSGSGWDSDAVCYPYIFEHNKTLYLLFNGNKYGLTGFGYATLKKKSLDQLIKHYGTHKGKTRDI